MAKLAIVIYSTYGHVAALAESVKAGIESVGSSATILQVAETLDAKTLELIHAPAKPDYPIVKAEDLTNYDGYLFGFPSRFGSFPAQINAFTDSTGGLWASGALYHKPAGFFISSGTPGSQEITARSVLNFFVHHGLIYVPLGFGKAGAQLSNIEEVHGGSVWGAGAFAGADGSRAVSQLEKDLAHIQGSEFAIAASKLAPSAPAAASTAVKEAVAETAAKADVATTTAATKAEAPKSESGCCTIV
ncbi:unnamed protein product [Kuraishia capsulata CBS 1993]|uniref:Flavodoxin-like domain-containing protein n=1 Tax=Kuraishia capsulata CBS 1993 TaxID=1382522 RepID=W6MM81_9ASCO|nr:uncharacterized protein KUCA_T00003615001 [Kuraishia capsulata CBS 1993]CDK27636.1 unnamed protein product [Kuraishia capsulata CBS 1993]